MGLLTTFSLSIIACGDKTKSDKKKNKAETVAETENHTESLGLVFKGSGYTISTPENWADSKTENSSLDLMVYDKDVNGGFARNLNVIIEDLSKYSSMDSARYLDAAKTKLIQAGYLVDNDKSFEVDGKAANSLEYSYTTNGYNVSGLQAYIYNPDNKKVYVITYSTSTEEFEEHKASGEAIINTFRFE